MTEKLFTGTLNKNQNKTKQNKQISLCLNLRVITEYILVLENYGLACYNEQMSCVTRNAVFWVSNQVLHKTGCIQPKVMARLLE